MKINKAFMPILISINKSIRQTAPVSVDGMPYGRAWVFEEIATRIGEDDPMLCSDVAGYEGVSPWAAERAKKSKFIPFEELEAVVLKILKEHLPQINEACPSLEERKEAMAYMETLV